MTWQLNVHVADDVALILKRYVTKLLNLRLLISRGEKRKKCDQGIYQVLKPRVQRPN